LEKQEERGGELKWISTRWISPEVRNTKS